MGAKKNLCSEVRQVRERARKRERLRIFLACVIGRVDFSRRLERPGGSACRPGEDIKES
jgi:hypothetical protein